MTEFAAPTSSPSIDLAAPPASSSTQDQSTTDAAKEQATAVGQSAADAGQHVAGVAKDQVQNVAAEAGTQAKELLDQTRTELGSHAIAQQQRVATGLHALGDELHAMTHHDSDPGVATDLARQGATRSHDLASWLEDREPGDLLNELKGFARRRPAAFLGLAAGAGLLAGRLTRGVKDAAGDDEPGVPEPSAVQGNDVPDVPVLPPATEAPAVAPTSAERAVPAPIASPDRPLGLGAGI